MKYIKHTFLTILAILILSGCKQEVSTTLYVRDLVDAVASKKVMTTAAAIKLEMPSSKSCGEKKDKLTRIISPFFIDLQKIQCIKEGSEDFYYAVFELPMVKVADDGNLNNNYKGGVSAQLAKNSDSNHIGIFLAMNLDLLSNLDKDLRNEIMGSGGIDPEDMKVKISINNDDRDTYNLYVEGAFLDGQAIIPRHGHTVELKRRSESVVTLADVSVFALTGRGRSSFAFVGNISPKTDEKKK